jgi:hypothetical protein
MSNPNAAPANQSRKRKSATVINEAVLSQQQAAMNAAKRSEMIANQRAKEYARQVAKINSNLYSGGRHSYCKKRIINHKCKSYRKRKTHRKRE